MGKINKYSNLYDKNGKIIRKVNSNGTLKNVTIPELEELIDKYDGDKNDRELDNMKMMLFRMYNTYGNPHAQELIDRIKAEAAKKTNDKEVKEKLEELNDDITDGLANHLINENDPITDAYEDMSKGGIVNQMEIMEFEAGKKHVIQAA